MLQDILKSTQSTISERLSSPLLGSFFLSWCMWNYKLVVVLLSQASVLQTFNIIDTIIFPDWKSLAFRGLILPLATSLAYIFLYPYPYKLIYEFTLRKQRENSSIRQRIQDETPLTLEESRKIRSEMTRIESEYIREIDRQSEEIARLKTSLSQISPPQTQTQEEPLTKLEPTIEKAQLNLLKIVEAFNGRAPEQQILGLSKELKVKTEFDLEELLNNNFISKSYDDRLEDYVYQFNQRGRGYLLRHRDD
jgi:hypothetical protein